MAASVSRQGQALAPSPATLKAPFLGTPIEICIVSPDAYKTMDSLLALGIGPWKVHTFDSRSVTSMTYRGQPAEYSLRVAFAEQGAMTWEIMQPVSGPSVMAEYIERTDGMGGIQHVAFDCAEDVKELSVSERIAQFEDRGYKLVQSGVWHGAKGTCEFYFFEGSQGLGAACLETIKFSGDWVDPTDTEHYPLSS